MKNLYGILYYEICIIQTSCLLNAHIVWLTQIISTFY